jgi:hypothetical protein
MDAQEILRQAKAKKTELQAVGKKLGRLFKKAKTLVERNPITTKEGREARKVAVKILLADGEWDYAGALVSSYTFGPTASTNERFRQELFALMRK